MSESSDGGNEDGAVGEPHCWSLSQTMNYIGQLAGQMVVTAKELYRGINPATLTGCIDIVVVKQPDGSCNCSPFHVRFGKMGVLRSREKVVDIEINGEPVDLHMKLGDNGEAFFVNETESTEEPVPPYLATSPISVDGAQLMAANLQNVSDGEGGRETSPEPPVSGGGGSGLDGLGSGNTSVRRRRKRRKRSEVEGHKKVGEQSSEEELFDLEIGGQEEKARSQAAVRPTSICLEPEINTTTFFGEVLNHHSDGEWCPLDSHELRSLSPKSDTELLTKSVNCEVPMLWPWGEFPEATKLERTMRINPVSRLHIQSSEETHFQVIYSPVPSDSGDIVTTSESIEVPSASPPFSPLSLPQREEDEDDDRDEHEDDDNDDENDNNGCSVSELITVSQPNSYTVMPSTPPPSLNSEHELADIEARQSEPEMQSKSQDQLDNLAITAVQQQLQLHLETTSSAPVDTPTSTSATADATSVITTAPAFASETTKAPGKQDSPSKKKEGQKRSRHQGPSDIYLDDLTELEPEVAARYFPKSEGGERVRQLSGDSQPDTQFPRCSADSGTDCQFDSDGDLPAVSLSLCGGLCENEEISIAKFEEQLVQFSHLSENPSIVEDPNLVVRISNKYYNWAVASPIILSMHVFQKNLPKVTLLFYHFLFLIFFNFLACLSFISLMGLIERQHVVHYKYIGSPSMSLHEGVK
uniref:Lipin 2 n=1 Tax=Eptatretus burgeri TaxID=7764 RepID=A0A8C4Q7Q4_EPTBU